MVFFFSRSTALRSQVEVFRFIYFLLDYLPPLKLRAELTQSTTRDGVLRLHIRYRR